MKRETILQKGERESIELEAANLRSFEPEAGRLNDDELNRFEAIVNEWFDALHGEERKQLATEWFSGMLARLRAKIGHTTQGIEKLKLLDEIGMAIVSDQVVTVDGHSSVGVIRLAPRLNKMMFEGQEQIRIVCEEELNPAGPGMLKVNTSVGEIAVREIVFMDHVTGKKQVRNYGLVDGKVSRVRNGRVLPQWLTWEENYALCLIKTILSNISE